MFAFLLGNYSLPFPMIELDRFDHTHVHRTLLTRWEEPMQLSICVPGAMPTRLRIANDNQKAVDHG